MPRIPFLSTVTLAALLVLACGGAEQPGGDAPAAGDPVAPLSVYTVNYPLQQFAERIGGDAVEVRFPAPGGVDPAYWSPGTETVAAYQSADLVLLNGAGYAGWVSRVSLSQAALVDTSAAIADRLLPLEEATTHSHGPEGEHEHTGTASTTWLDPTLAAEQARAIAAALTEARPASAAVFAEGLAALEGDLEALDRRLQAVAARVGDEPLLFSHPVYQYLIARYGLNGRSLHWEPDAAPDLHDLEHAREGFPARWMIWEGEPLAAAVQALEGAGVGSLVFAPCGNRPAEGDYLSVMEANVAALERAFPE
jgi:zinc transport system substrate-binding protein